MVLKVGMIDVDLLNNGTRHPNLAQMKMSSYCKSQGYKVKLVYAEKGLENLESFNYLIVSKVFNFTPIPEQLTKIIEKSGKSLVELNKITLSKELKKYQRKIPKKVKIHIVF